MPAPVPIDPCASVRAHFAHTLRAIREMRGLTQAELAKEMIVSREAIASYERDRATPEPDFFDKLDAFFGTQQIFQGFRHHMRREHIPSWFLSYLPHEAEANEVHTFQRSYIPGLLQIEEYIRSIAPPKHPDEWVYTRLERIERLHGDDQFHLFAVIDESALMRCIGGKAVMYAQLGHLLEMAELPNVTIQVVSAQTDWHWGMSGSIVILSKKDHTRVGWVEAHFGGRLIEDPSDVAKLSLMLDGIRSMAFPVPASLALIRSAMEAFQDEAQVAKEQP